MNALVDETAYPNLARLTSAVLDHWPKHQRYLEKNFADRDAEVMRFSDRLSEMVIKLSTTVDGRLPGLASDYRFISEKIILPEEVHFRRHDSYRLKTFAEAIEQVYSRTEFMTRYMNGLLVTDVLWLNHCLCMQHYATQFLPALQPGADLLEIGPGHGLLLCLATHEKNVGEVTAWDVSDASLTLSQHSLSVLGPGKSATFQKRDIFGDMEKSDEGRFDAVVLSEVLEHLEHPEQAVAALFRLCRPGGRVWVNVPANSPAPDHLYLVRSPEQAADLLRGAGFEIVDTASFATSGTTLERAIRDKLTVSCVVVGRRPAGNGADA